MVNKGKILIVDDDNKMLSYYKTEIGQIGYNVTCINDIEKAIEEIKINYFDIIITDLKIDYYLEDDDILKDDGGMVLIKLIKDISPNTFIIVITGFGTLDIATKVFNDGIFSFIEKKSTLFEEINTALTKIYDIRKRDTLNPNVLESIEIKPLEYGIELSKLEIKINNNWKLTDFISFFDVCRRMYTLFLVISEVDFGKSKYYDTHYLEKLNKSIEIGLFENDYNAIYLSSIQFNSPGIVVLKGVSEPIRALGELIEKICKIPFIRKNEVENIIEKQLKNDKIRLENERAKYENFKIKCESISTSLNCINEIKLYSEKMALLINDNKIDQKNIEFFHFEMQKLLSVFEDLFNNDKIQGVV